jgi:D-beta-D-heptose 7-phosphate kinase/D-beta-D-heptose 1-phosphate adenosyltransferase
MSSLLQTLASWKPFTAIVVGDFMLDQMVYGDAERLAADAPVPVLHVRRTESNAGGAANVCLDLAALGGKVIAFGVIGDDMYGRELRQELERRGIDASGLTQDTARPTTVKQNLVGLAQARHPQKMFRLDYESREPLPEHIVRDMLGRFEAALKSADVVCIEDYAKGVCSEAVCRAIIGASRAAGKPVFVDPARQRDYSKYAHAAAITPNRTEAETAAGIHTHPENSLAHNSALARTLRDQLDLDACILTLDRHGALLLERDGVPLSVPTVARQVYDVTGAGDMFLAGLAAARANGASWRDAVEFANTAAGLEVEVFGVQPIPLERVHHQVLVQQAGVNGKYRTREQLLLEIAAKRKEGRRIVFTNGCFDILHAGHVWLLDQARAQGDYLVVATNTDEKVREFKGPNRPVNTLEDRVRVLSGLSSVDAVVVFEEDTPAELIEAVRPDVLAKGDEYADANVVGAAFVRSIGGTVTRIPMMPGKSTTATLTKAGDPRAATAKDEAKDRRFTSDSTRP